MYLTIQTSGTGRTKENDRLDKRKLIYHLLHRAFIDIRMAAHDGRDSKGFFRLADLFHNVPLALDRLDRNKGDVDELFEEIVARAEWNGSQDWLEHAVRDINASADI